MAELHMYGVNERKQYTISNQPVSEYVAEYAVPLGTRCAFKRFQNAPSQQHSKRCADLQRTTNTVYKIDAGTGARMTTYIPTLIHACVLDHVFNLENPFSHII